MTYEWENADEAMGILDKAGMPYGVLGGNHDVAAGLADYEIITNISEKTDLRHSLHMVEHIRTIRPL